MRERVSHQTVLFILFDPVVRALSELAIFSGFMTTRSNTSVHVSYDHQQHPIRLLECQDVIGNFSVDEQALVHNITYASARDNITWTAESLSAQHENLMDWTVTTNYCKATGNYSLSCNEFLNQLAIFYSTSFPSTRGLVNFFNNQGPLAFCRVWGGNSFLVTGYEYSISPSAQPSLSSSPTALISFSPSMTAPYAPSITPVMPQHSHAFNPNWLIFIVGGSILLFLAAVFLQPRSRASAIGLFNHKSRSEEKGLLGKSPGFTYNTYKITKSQIHPARHNIGMP